MIKNAITYNVEMPKSPEMQEFISGYESIKPDEYQVETLGFAKHPVTGDFVSEFAGGYCLSILRWTKRIDRAAVNEALKERVSQFFQPLKKKEKDDIKQQIIIEMIPYILPSPKYIFAYYHYDSNTLIIDSPSGRDADQATSLMRKAIGSLKATTLYIDTRIGLTASLKNHLEFGDEFIGGDISLGNNLELSSLEGKVKFTDLDLLDSSTSDEIIAQVTSGGMHIKSVELRTHSETFNLTNEFKIKKIKFDFEIGEDEDKISTWLSETKISTQSIVLITKQLIDKFQVVD